jgi:hypothetical protein
VVGDSSGDAYCVAHQNQYVLAAWDWGSIRRQWDIGRLGCFKKKL